MKKIYLVAIFLVATLGMSACSSKQNSQTNKQQLILIYLKLKLIKMKKIYKKKNK